MKNVIMSFGDYPTFLDAEQTEGPYTSEQLGTMWLDWVAELSADNVKRYHLILVTPQKTVLPESIHAWGTLTRFDENSGVSGWPQGPNAVFKQVQWYYYHKRLTGAFLWCEPDCIPVSPDWLDLLADEYLRSYKPFMGGLVDVRSIDGKSNVPRHMTGNAIYPDRAFEKAPALMEANNTPWDVYAAQQIIKQCHFTPLIQHVYRHPEIKTMQELRAVLEPKTVLFHSDKYGAIRRLLGRSGPDRGITQQQTPGRPLVEVFAEEEGIPYQPSLKNQPPASLSDFTIPNILDYLKERCEEREVRTMVANFMVRQNIVTQGHLANYAREVKKQKALDGLAAANP